MEGPGQGRRQKVLAEQSEHLSHFDVGTLHFTQPLGKLEGSALDGRGLSGAITPEPAKRRVHSDSPASTGPRQGDREAAPEGAAANGFGI